MRLKAKKFRISATSLVGHKIRLIGEVNLTKPQKYVAHKKRG